METFLGGLGGRKGALLTEDGVYFLKPPTVFEGLSDECEKIYALAET